MKYAWVLLVAEALSLPVSALAQSALRAGTIIPVTLNRGLRADRAQAGRAITAKVMQDIPGTPVRRGSQVLGHVVQVQAPEHGPSRLELTFDSVRAHGQTIPLKADLRAIASFVAVGQAEVPEEGASRGITPEVATFEQIGGEQVYRGGGTVYRGNDLVGKPTPYGVLAMPRASSGNPCRGAVGQNARPQAFWVFSTDACGVYGLSDLRVEHAGRTDPMGNIVLASNGGKLRLASGTAMLLRVQSDLSASAK
jgi:hypothetical protein